MWASVRCCGEVGNLHHQRGQSSVAAFRVQFATCDDGGLSGPELMPHAVGARDPTDAGHGAKQLSEGCRVRADVASGSEMDGIDVRLTVTIAKRLRTRGAAVILRDRYGVLRCKIDNVHNTMRVDSPTHVRRVVGMPSLAP